MSHTGTRGHEGHADTKDHETTPRHEGAARHEGRNAHTRAAPTPRDAAADQLQLLLFLAADWTNNDRTHAREIAALAAALSGAQAAPVNVDVPYVSQTGNVLSCTMGNWQGEPTGYTYAWHSDGVANGATDPTYSIQPDDSGHGMACVVAATNAQGTTVAPMSNAVTIA
jgi:hypothetical protein